MVTVSVVNYTMPRILIKQKESTMKLETKTPCSVATALTIMESGDCNTVYLSDYAVDLTNIGGTRYFNLYSTNGHCLYYNVTMDTVLSFEFFNLIPFDDSQMNVYLNQG